MLDLSRAIVEQPGLLAGIGTDAERYHSAAVMLLDTLCSGEFLARSRPGWEGILLHGIYHYHKGLGVDESVAWGDHFFVEALVKALGAPAAG